MELNSKKISNYSNNLITKQKINYGKHSRKLILMLTMFFILIFMCFLLLYLKLLIKDEINMRYQKEKTVDQNTIAMNTLEKQIESMQIKVISIRGEKNADIKTQSLKEIEQEQVKDKNKQLLSRIIKKKRYREMAGEMSVILSANFLEQIESLTKCKFLLNCYRLSRDGYFAKVFHEKCDGLKPTVTMILGEYNSLFGGFTTKSWEGNGLKRDNKAFLFSLIYNTLLDIRRNMPAIHTSPELLPTFGINDIYISEEEATIRKFLQSYTSDKNSKSAHNIEKKDNIEMKNLEVFQMDCENSSIQ